MIVLERPSIYRLTGDRAVEYGDGGYSALVYPVWIHDSLPVSDSIREKLASLLHSLSGPSSSSLVLLHSSVFLYLLCLLLLLFELTCV